MQFTASPGRRGVGPELLGAARAFLAGGQLFLKSPALFIDWDGNPTPGLMRTRHSAGPDGTFGNRFDDPDATYRVLYASPQRLACFLETLARFRVDPELLTELAEIAGEDDFWPPGEVPSEWADKRLMGAATASGDYADICSSELDQQAKKIAGDTSGKIWLRRLRHVRFATDSPADLDPVRYHASFSTTTWRVSTIAPNMDTTLKTGPSSSPVK